MTEGYGYGEPRTALTDAANDVGRNLEPTDPSWLTDLTVGYLYARSKNNPDLTPKDLVLDILAVLHGIRTKCDEIIANTVAGARQHNATWPEIGTRLGISKQTAFSRYGSVLEHRNEGLVIVDIVRDAVFPMERITADTPPTPAQANPIPPTPGQTQMVAERYAGTEGGSPENIHLVANAFVTLARQLCANAGGNWNDPEDWEHYLNLAMDAISPKLKKI